MTQRDPLTLLLRALPPGVSPIAGGTTHLQSFQDAVTLGQSLKATGLRTTSANGSGVKLSAGGPGKAFAIIDCATYNDGTHTVTFEESNNDNTADEHAAADAYAAVSGGPSTAVTAVGVQAVDVYHRKPYVRGVSTVTGSPNTGAILAIVLGTAKRLA